MIIRFFYLLFLSSALMAKDQVEFNENLYPQMRQAIKHIEAWGDLKSLKPKLEEIDRYSKSTKTMQRLNQLFETEFNKIILNTKFERYISKNIITSSQITTAMSKLEQNKALFSELSYTTISRFLNDFKPFLKDKKLDNFQLSRKNKKINTGEKLQLTRIIKYSAPWISFFLSTPAEKMNKFFSKIASQYLDNISKQLKVLELHGFSQSKMDHNLFPGLDSINYESKISTQKLESPIETNSNPMEILKNIPTRSRSESIDQLLQTLPDAK